MGTVGAGAAHAAVPGPADGVIAFQGPSGGVQAVHADGTGLHTLGSLPGSGNGGVSWSSDGSRVAVGGWGAVTTARPDGSGQATVSSGQNVSTQNGVYGASGAWLVSDAGGKIYRQTSDGWSWASRVLTDAQEPTGTCDSQPAFSYQGLYAFTRRDCSMMTAAGVWTYNPVTHALQQVVANAAAPVFSADGKTLLYVTAQGGTTQIGAANPDGTGQHLLTNDASGASQPSLSPDGTQLVYASYDGSHGGNVIKLLNIAAGTTTELANGTDPSWQPLRTQYVDRIYGTSGVSNDAAASRWQFNTVGKSAPGLVTAFNAVLVNRSDATDAALGIELAGEKQAPLLMTSGTSLDPATAAELRRVLHPGWTVYLEGNTSVLSAHVAAQVQALGLRVVRVGASGTDQSVATARTLTSTPTWVILADSEDYRLPASAATAAASAGYHGRVVVLINSGWSLPSSITNYLNSLNSATTGLMAVGGRNIYALQHPEPLRQGWRYWPIGGGDAETISVNLAKFWWGSPYVVTVGGTDWGAAMAGTAVNAGFGPLLWTSSKGLDSVDWAYLSFENAGVHDVQLFGAGWYMSYVNAIGSAIAAGPSWLRLFDDPNGAPPPLTAHAVLPQGPAVALPGATRPLPANTGAGAAQPLRTGR